MLQHPRCYVLLGLLFALPLIAVPRGQEAPRPQPSEATGPGQAVVVQPSKIKLQPFPNLPACARGAVLHGDPSNSESVFLVHMKAGCMIPWHWHTPNEQVGIISGIGTITMKNEQPQRLGPGGYAFLPSHHIHRFSCAGPCRFFVGSDAAFDIHYVDAAGQEITPEQALKAAKPAPRRPVKKMPQ